MIKTDRLELNIVRHCNNRCALCNHGSPVADHYFMQRSVLEHDLRLLSSLIHCGSCCLQGGEPLLHPDIVGLIDSMVGSGIAGEYHILSNGTMLDSMTDDFWNRLSKFRMVLRLTLYPNQKWTSGLEVAKKKCAELGIDLRPYVSDSFFRVFKKVKDDGKITFSQCPWKECHTIHEGWFYHCPLTTFFPSQFLGLPEHIDGIELDGLTEKKLIEFLSATKTPRTCGWCCGTTGGKVPWHETNDRSEWFREIQEDELG